MAAPAASAATIALERLPLGFGLGTIWYQGVEHNTQGSIDLATVDRVYDALQAGFRHLDLAELYGNEREVAQGLEKWFTQQESRGISRATARAELWITGKASYSLGGDIVAACRDTIARLGCTYLDLYLAHCPVHLLSLRYAEYTPAGLTNVAIWRQMEDLVAAGLARYIGLSNFRGSDIRELFSQPMRVKPVVHQVEFHPFLQQRVLQQLSESHGMRMSAYGSLTPITQDGGQDFQPLQDLLATLAAKYGVSAATILQRYTEQRGFLVITTTRTPSRLQEYLRIDRVTLAPEDIAEIDRVGEGFAFRSFWNRELPPTDAGLE
jgi:alcohol dehydrogenase (NADP+)